MEENREYNRRPLDIAFAVIMTITIIFGTYFAVKMIQVKYFSDDSTAKLPSQSYYYSKLDTTQQDAYNALKKEINDMPKFILLPDGMDIDSVNMVIETFRADNSFSAFIAVDKMSFVDSYFIDGLKVTYTMSKDEYEKIENTLNSKIESIVSSVPEGLDDFEKEVYLHDYLIENTDYEINNKPLSNTVCGALIDKKSACVGYAQAMKMLLNAVGIDCITVCGEADDGTRQENHMYNQVKIEGEWYNLDPTWDDAVGEYPTLTHKFFNLTDKDLSKTHKAYIDVNECNAVSNNYFVKKGLLFDSYNEECKDKIFKEIAKSTDSAPAEIRFSSEEEYQKACQKLVAEDIFLGQDKIKALNSKQIDIENTGIIRCDSLNIVEFKVSYK